jgi:ribosomal protein S25
MLAQKADIDPTLAGKTLYVLNKLGVVKKIGKKKTQAWVYGVNL